jgi:outer membrane lipoprotein
MEKSYYNGDKMKRFFILCILSAFIVSCAHVISREYRDSASRDIPFSSVVRNPQNYLDEVFILGGIIVETRISDQGSEIEAVQTPVDRFGNIIDRDISEGRFILITQRYLDPSIFRKDRVITVAGILTGSRKRLLGDIEYTYPVIEARELYLWREERYSYYPSYAYPYWYDPFYYSPFYYRHRPFWPRPYFYP